MTVLLDQESMTYPRHLLDDCDSALLLFCSGRMGAADGHWVREAGITDATCVDWDGATLEPFANEYPREWTYIEADVFEWAPNQYARGHSWELVSADAPSQYGDRLREMLPIYCELADKYVVATLANTGPGAVIIPDPPEGWRYIGEPIWRTEYQSEGDELSRKFWWLVLERT